jgi:hypothetical protein
MEQNDLGSQAKQVLVDNNRHDLYTVPAKGLYPHQWLWDSCFIAIGIRHYDVPRAQQEILSLLRGQWTNGMVPNMVFSKTDKHRRDSNLWRSWQNPNAPDEVATSGITQPPVLAEAIVRIGEKLNITERRMWYQKVFPALVRYHEWLYRERDPHNEGLVLLVHPWESGFDNTPPWMHELHEHSLPFWVGVIRALKLDRVVNAFRRDVKFVPSEQRLSTVDILALYNVQRRLRRKAYDIDRILRHALFTVEDANFNAMLIRANTHLKSIAKDIKEPLPDELKASMKKSEQAFETLWDPYSGQYYSRNFTSHKLIKVPSIATLLPLYAGHITQERAEQLVRMLENKDVFGADFPVPTTPLNSEWYKEMGYWQGPTWINTNWLIADGLRRYGFDKQADVIMTASLALVEESGSYEYFSAKTGEPAGAADFSWTAALTLDFLDQLSRQSSTKSGSKSQK